MVRVYHDEDASLRPLSGKTVSVIGYGSQGRAQALNIRDSGIEVVVGLRPEGGSWSRARADGLRVLTISNAVDEGDVILFLIPDMVQPSVYKEHIKSSLKKGKVLDFAHGFNIHYKQIVPPIDVDVVMVAPKSPGLRLRETFQSGFGVQALVAVHQDFSGQAMETALALAKAMGCSKAGVIETSFKDETESDLLGEQAVLVGGLIELIRNGFEVLVESGYPPELAYFEACNEAKLIMDLIYERGITGMLSAVSDTAKYGGLIVGPKVIDSHVKTNMRNALKAVQSGEFARRWVDEHNAGEETLKSLMEKIATHEIEVVGAKIRKTSGIQK